MVEFRRSRAVRSGLAIMAMLFALVACSAGPAGGGDLLDRVREQGTLRVALTQANPPWNFLDEASTQPAGYDVDVANELARRLGVGEVEFVASNFQSFIEGVRAGRFDMVISGQTITEERRTQVDFSLPYQVNGVSIFVAAGDGSITTLADLDGRSVGVSAGTTQEEMAREIAGADVRTYQNATLGLTDLGSGGVDSMLVSRFQGTFLADRNGLPVQPAGELLEREVNGMSFAQGSPRFKQAVDEALTAMIDDGTLTEISQRWLGGEDMAAQLRALPADLNR